jgi:hypothetical protein
MPRYLYDPARLAIGFDLARAQQGGGMGLRGIAKWLESLGGTLDISSTPGRGTCLRVELAGWNEHEGAPTPDPLTPQEEQVLRCIAGLEQPAGRRPPLHQRSHGALARQQPAAQAAPRQPGSGHTVCPAHGPGRPEPGQ